MKKKIYKIEYGMAHMGGTGRRGIEYHISRVLTGKEVKKRLKKLNKKYEYTTLHKLKETGWEAIG